MRKEILSRTAIAAGMGAGFFGGTGFGFGLCVLALILFA